MIDEDDLAEELFGIRPVKRSHHTTWNDEAIKQREEVPRDSENEVDTDSSHQSDHAVWHDEHDESVSIHLGKQRITKKFAHGRLDKVVNGQEFTDSLRKQFIQVNKVPKWANAEEIDQDLGLPDFLTDILASAKPLKDLPTTSQLLHTSSKKPLSNDRMNIRPLPDVNTSRPTSGVVKCVDFHPKLSLCAVSGTDDEVNLFNVDEKENAHFHSLKFVSGRISKALFTPDGKSLLISGKKPRYWTYDLTSGVTVASQWNVAVKHGQREKNLESMIVPQDETADYFCFLGSHGNVLIYSLRSHQHVCDIKVNGEALCGTFVPTTNSLLIGTNEGKVYELDMNLRRCVATWVDEAGLGNAVTAISVDAKRQYLATGSEQGIVTLYSTAGPGTLLPHTTLKSISNLQTKIDTIALHPSGELCVVASHSPGASTGGKKALRAIHTATQTVFTNWPTTSTPFRNATSVAFSSNGVHMAVGTDKHRVLLYKLNHYI
ncbi:putative U3 small nucleolar RNA-associated protein 18 like protein [Blattamonas nauphoetae]|uniref:U3 small nucleolar RNA-associated protein 18 like protein n=1 Tax=Blattamonas nauphoetae TaxID=2049346 RepID=A0ABQ9XM90_9EUKA|nr:putative U3 small nucleolar RNA-associated protein 18 like protein [Blattamonas nauphoetae]